LRIEEVIDVERILGNILISSVSKKVPLITALREAVRKIDEKLAIFGADINVNCIASYFVDEIWSMPRIPDLNITDFIQYCHDNGITTVIPTRDGELPYYARYRSKLLEHGIYVMVSKLVAIETTMDKLLFYEFLFDRGFPVIPTSSSLDDLSGEQYVVKERLGSGARSMAVNVSEQKAKEHAKLLNMPIFQPFVRGKEYSIDLYVDMDSKAKGAVVRERRVVIDGESQVTTTVRNAQLEKLSMDIVESLGLYGHVVLQLIVCDEGKVHIIECNARFGGASTLSVEYGLDSFYWFLLESAGCELNNYPFIRNEQTMTLVRYPADLIYQNK
jgi:carbamoyl-phosphate synthase large subunit